MAGRLYIPEAVRESIAEHFRVSVAYALDGFWSANEDEDTLTGHLGACLRTKAHTVIAAAEQSELPGKWTWSIDYTKFRGRGPKATEKAIGADGLFEISLTHGTRHDKKSVLFQSKLDWTTDADILKQSLLLSTWREAAFVLNYTDSGFETFSIDDVVRSRGEKPSNSVPLEETLADYFLECKLGDTRLEYDAKTRLLTWRTSEGLRVATQFSIPDRIRVRIKAPGFSPSGSYDKIVPIDEIHNHRMNASHREVLQNLLSDKVVSEKKKKKELSLAYHPDHFQTLDDLFKDIATRRMQEINNAYEQVRI